MSRNTNSRFALNPQVNILRSRFDMSSGVTTTFNVGELVPFYLFEVLPGDSIEINTSKVVRLQTLLAPIFSNLYLDCYYFFVPNRLVWEHWKQMNGENTSSAWIPQVEYTVPQVSSPSGGWNVGTIADYMGLPTGVDNVSVSALPFRAYSLICNEFFRNQNLSEPLNIPVNDTDIVGSNGTDYVTDTVKGGAPFKAAKYFDYFTSCLPGPQKGNPVTLNLSGDLPVSTGASHAVDPVNMMWKTFDSSKNDTTTSLSPVSGSYYWPAVAGTQFNGTNTDVLSRGYRGSEGVTVGDATYMVPSNLWADMSSATAITVNDLRTAFQIQKMYEKDARGGTRYIEMIKEHFGVTNPDYRLQRPEYLGGNRIPITVHQVVQNSSTDATSPQGHTSAYSLTTDNHSDFFHSFTEHGYIIGLMVARYDHSYQQGIERHWSRKSRLDYYLPVFANLGEQAVLNKEIFAQGSAVLNPDTSEPVDDEVFGYQERWAEYRYKPSIITGEMRSTYATSLDSWHLGDEYASLPYLSDSWIREDKDPVDRVLAVTSAVSNQLMADLFIQNKATRPMPMFSIPGLVDHH